MHGLITPIIVGILVVAVLALATRLLGRRVQVRSGNDGVSTYEAVLEFLSPAERSFFGVLQQAVASEYQIFAKVRLADIVRPARNPSRSGWQTAFNRITGKHVDFVLCEPGSLRVLAVIELDDRTHERFERGVRDNLVDSALANAGIPVLRVAARQAYSPVQMREQVQSLFPSNAPKPNQHIA
jgi:hypothetical protein